MWRKLSESLPVYGGAVYIRWGRATCPERSKYIYKGQMVGPDYHAPGGGSNYLCMHDDPDYSSKTFSGKFFSNLQAAFYGSGSLLRHRQIPCVVCESKQRVTQLMIPAKTKCPMGSGWVLEYEGILMSPWTGNSADRDTYRGSYVCVDKDVESTTNRTSENAGHRLLPVSSACTGDGIFADCPPYRTDVALSCVVCSK